MSATAGTTTVEIPLPLRARLASHRTHARQAYHEVIGRALDALEGRGQPGALDPLVARHRDALRRAAREHGIVKLWLFGSRARGEARPDSDVDLLYQAPADVDIWSVSGFLADAGDILGTRVDLLDIDRLPARLAHVAADGVPV